MASYFSPTPTNFTGCPVTCLIDRAAPPRASPSILVSTTPDMPTRRWNSSAERTASWPVIASATKRISTGRVSAGVVRPGLLEGGLARGLGDDGVLAARGGSVPARGDGERIALLVFREP